MPSTYSPDLRIELIANGEQSGTWGTTTNSNLGTLVEQAIAGLAYVSATTANQALTVLNGASDEARCAALSLSTTTGANFAVYVPPVTKLYAVRNTSSFVATVYANQGTSPPDDVTPAGTGVAIPAGKAVLLRCDGTNIAEQLNYRVGDFGFGGNVAVGGELVVDGAATFTGIPTAPTADPGTNDSQLATTAFVLANGVPSGAISLWSGSIASIPSGWLLCDGTNGTPNLRDKFIVGAGSAYAVAATGGSADAITVAHTHTATTASSGAHQHFVANGDTASPGSNVNAGNSVTYWRNNSPLSQPNYEYIFGGTATTPTVGLTNSAGTHTHTLTTASTGSSGTNANLPPYYALAYIMKA